MHPLFAQFAAVLYNQAPTLKAKLRRAGGGVPLRGLHGGPWHDKGPVSQDGQEPKSHMLIHKSQAQSLMVPKVPGTELSMAS